MKLDINGVMYEFDLDRISVRDAMALKTATGMNLKPFSAAFGDMDPDVYAAVGWLALTKAGVKGADGEPIQLKDVDFDMLSFLTDDEPEDDAADDEVPSGPPTTGDLRPGGVTPDSTSPEPSTTTD